MAPHKRAKLTNQHKAKLRAATLKHRRERKAFDAEVGRKLRLMRQALEVSTTKLQEDCIISVGQLSLIERGRRGISLYVADSLCKALEIPLTDILP